MEIFIVLIFIGLFGYAVYKMATDDDDDDLWFT